MRKIIVAALAVFILFVALEVILRTYYAMKIKVSFFAKLYHEVYDPVLGWKGVENMGDTSSKKFKIFFVGDSFTAPYLDGGMYFDVVKRGIDIEAFIYGGRGGIFQRV